jgi:electron-transferring-flavoprotein dehydrogenase
VGEKINAAIEKGEQEPFAVAVFDINDLKKVNDLHGHKEGDACIRAACKKICTIFDHSPVFRVGGDEFIAILSGADYETLLKRTSGWKEMKRVRNVRAGFCYGLPFGVAAAALAWLTRGLLPFFRVPGLEAGDGKSLEPLECAVGGRCVKMPASPSMPDRLTDVFMSGTRHEEDQPCHIRLADPARCAACAEKYGAPCERFCPAEVYSVQGGKVELDFSNCIHCKTCKIKCPEGNVEWTFPQGGDGPGYTRM